MWSSSLLHLLALASTLAMPSNALPAPNHRGGRNRGGDSSSAATTTSAAAAIPAATEAVAAAPAAGSGASGNWVPAVGTSWQIVLSAPLQIDASKPSVSPDVQVYDIDLFDNTPETIAALHSLGKKVICYFSAGTYEEWRPDASKFQSGDFGSDMADWPGEKWLNLKSDNVRKIMSERIKLAKDKGCDAIDPDNVDAYSNENGLGLTQADSVDFVKFLSAEARRNGLSVGLKNAGEIIPSVIADVDFQVNEECVKYGEGRTFEAFIKAGKAVFHIEYPSGTPGQVSTSYVSSLAAAAGTEKFSTVIKTLSLDGWVQFKDGSEGKTQTKY